MNLTIFTPEGEEVLEFDQVAEETLEGVGDDIELSEEEDIYEGAYLLESAGRSCQEFELGRMGGVPEFKQTMERQRTGPRWARIYVRVPVFWTRTSTIKLFARVCVSTNINNAAWRTVRECALATIGSGAIAGVIGSPASAIPAAKAALIGCLKAKGLETVANSIDLGLFTRKVSGEWRRRS